MKTDKEIKKKAAEDAWDTNALGGFENAYETALIRLAREDEREECALIAHAGADPTIANAIRERGKP